MSMGFFDVDPVALPINCDYYFGVKIFMVFDSKMKEDCVVLLDGITNPRPFLIWIMPGEDGWSDEGLGVVEVNQNTTEVSWYAL